MTNKIWRGVAALGVVLIAASLHAQTIRVGGVGSMTPLLRHLAVEYQKARPQVKIEVMDPPVGSTGGIRALAAGKLDLIFSGRKLKNGEQGEVQPWVHTALVLATSDGPATPLDAAKLTDIYNGNVKTWDDGRPMRLILRGAFESETMMLRRLSPEMDQAVSAALARRQDPVADNDLNALNMIGKVSGSLGSTSLGLVLATQSPVRLIPINGLVPSVENLASGHYPWTRPYYMVLPQQPSADTQHFATFLMSEPALRLARKLGYLPFKD